MKTIPIPNAEALARFTSCMDQEILDMDVAELVLETITSRHSVSPKILDAPGPSDAQLLRMIEAASCAPDHGLLRPWRFVTFPARSRASLAKLFEAALLERKPEADEEDRRRARDKAARAPMLVGVIVRLDGDDAKAGDPNRERVIPDDQYASAGAALQNILLVAHAMGFGARATSGRAVRTKAFRSALNLKANEQFLCFLAIGTPKGPGKIKARPEPETLLTSWEGTE